MLLGISYVKKVSVTVIQTLDAATRIFFNDRNAIGDTIQPSWHAVFPCLTRFVWARRPCQNEEGRQTFDKQLHPFDSFRRVGKNGKAAGSVAAEPWFWKVLFICDPFRFTLVYPTNQRLTVPENRTIQICYIMFTNLHAFMKECKTTKSYTLILPIHSPHQPQIQNAFDALVMWNRAKAKPTVDRSFCGTVCTRLRQNSIRHNIEPRETRWKTGQCGNVSVAQNPTILKPCFIVFGDRFGRVWSVYRSLHRVRNPNIFDLPMILV